jgi:hypothetical protein
LGKNGAALAVQQKERHRIRKMALRALVPYWNLLSLSAIARYLNDLEIKTPKGHTFYVASVRNYF